MRDEGRCGEEGRSDVGVETKFFAKFQESDFGAEGRVSSPFGSSDSSYESRDRCVSTRSVREGESENEERGRLMPYRAR